jgi:predicted ATPase/class 3 adenylate cyclase
MQCPGCNYDNPAENRFCEQCGTHLERCIACGAPLRPTSRFCGACGAATDGLSSHSSPPPAGTSQPEGPAARRARTGASPYTPRHLVEKILNAPSALQGERRQVTVLFADLAGFTTLAASRDPEEVHAIIDRCFEAMTREVHRYEGTVNQYTGDGIMALFGAPIAHEDSASRAVHAALAIQAGMKVLSREVQAGHGVALDLRVGLNTGQVVVGRIGDDLRMDYTAVGDTTNLAARMQQSARPGAVVIAEATHAATQGQFETVGLGELSVKGRAAVQAYEVVRALGHRARLELAAERGLTPLVGRLRELAMLRDLFDHARTGHGQVVLIAGEAGIGKSRLLHEFRSGLEGAGIEFSWLENRCISYGQSTALGPLLEQLRRTFAIGDRDDAAAIGVKIEQGVEQMGLHRAEVPVLRYLLSLDPGDPAVGVMDAPTRRARIFEAMRALTAAAASQRPLVLVFEDLHWVDKATEEYLKWLLDAVAGLPILLVATHRLDYTSPLGSRSFLSTLPLRNLDTDEALRVAGLVLGSVDLPDELKRVVLDKADGVPLFVEELTHTLVNLGAVERAGSALRMTRSFDKIAVPDTIQGIIMARIDRLGDDGKRVVQHASVIGRQFVQRLLVRVAPVERVEPLLRELKALEIIHEQTQSPEPAYIFRHALIQDVVYNSLLRERRRELHRDVGLAIEELYPDRVAERLEELAHHFANAEAWDKAFGYLVRSGDRAKDAYASQAALDFYKRALEAAANMSPPPPPARIIAVYQRRGVAWRISSGYAQAIAEFEHMLELARAAGDTLAEGEALVELALAHYLTASSEHIPAATTCANAALGIAEQTGDERILARSLCYLGLIDQVDGKLHEGDSKFSRSLEISERRGYQDMVSQNLAWLSLHANWRGEFDAAVPLCRRSREAATVIHDGFHEMMALSNLAFPLVGMGDYAGAGLVMDEAVRLARERDNKFMVARVLNTRGWMCQELGDFRSSSDFNQEALQAAPGNPNAEISTLINVAYDRLHGGDRSAALELLEQTLERVDKHAFGAHRWRWTIHLSQYIGETLLACGNPDDALRMADRALERATQTGSLKYVGKARALRGAVALQQGAAPEAARELSEAAAIAGRIDYVPLVWQAGHLLLRAQLHGDQREEAIGTAKLVDSAISRLAAAAPLPSQRHTFLEWTRVNAAMEDVARLLG